MTDNTTIAAELAAALRAVTERHVYIMQGKPFVLGIDSPERQPEVVAANEALRRFDGQKPAGEADTDIQNTTVSGKGANSPHSEEPGLLTGDMVSVPKEPTMEMLQAGAEAWDEWANTRAEDKDGVEMIYKAPP